MNPNSIEKLFRHHPDWKLQDGLKWIYQSHFGNQHLFKELSLLPEDEKHQLRSLFYRLQDECKLAKIPPKESGYHDEKNGYFVTDCPFQVEPLNARWVRVHLTATDDENIFCLFRLLIASASSLTPDVEGFRHQMEELIKWVQNHPTEVRQNEHDKSIAQIIKQLTEYRENPVAVHHSESYRQKVQPHYRLIRKDFMDYFGVFKVLFSFLKQNGLDNEWMKDLNRKTDYRNASDFCVIALDGKCASGKTTFASLCQEVFDANVFHMDDFFLRPEQRTAERLKTVGGNVDIERFVEEVLNPLLTRKPFSYRPFDCHTLGFKEAVHVKPKKINFIEGAYSLKDEIFDAAQLKILFEPDEDVQLARLAHRNPQMIDRFVRQWIPMENTYLSAFNLRKRVDYVFKIHADENTND